MEQRTLNYYTPPQPSGSPWRELKIVVFYGPLIGFLVGAVQMSAVVLCWVLDGRPDFYFRGPEGLALSIIANCAGGAIVGVVYGAGLTVIEEKFGRRVRLLRAGVIVVFGALFIGIGVTWVEFWSKEILLLLKEALTVVMGWVVSWRCSARLQIEEK